MIRDPLAVFLKDFAEDAAVVFEWETDGIPHSLTVNAIFDNSFVDAAIGETAMDTTAPRLTCQASEVATLPREALVVIRGKSYSVVQVQPDGTGFTVIHLASEA